MKKTLPAIALFVALATGATTSASANLHAAHNEGLQNYYYYFGAPCCDRIASAAPCGVAAAPCAAPCNPCAPMAVTVPMEVVCSTPSCM